jgi:hypothetical protein
MKLIYLNGEEVVFGPIGLSILDECDIFYEVIEEVVA